MDLIETAKIAAIVRSIMKQMNLLKPDKDPEDYIKNVDELQYEPSVGEIFTTWYVRNRDVYENRIAGHAATEVPQDDHDLYLAYLLTIG
ncbi:hypothetical protein ACTXT7_017324 [Hymenolepis weldensis]